MVTYLSMRASIQFLDLKKVLLIQKNGRDDSNSDIPETFEEVHSQRVSGLPTTTDEFREDAVRAGDVSIVS